MFGKHERKIKRRWIGYRSETFTEKTSPTFLQTVGNFLNQRKEIKEEYKLRKEMWRSTPQGMFAEFGAAMPTPEYMRQHRERAQRLKEEEQQKYSHISPHARKMFEEFGAPMPTKEYMIWNKERMEGKTGLLFGEWKSQKRTEKEISILGPAVYPTQTTGQQVLVVTTEQLSQLLNMKNEKTMKQLKPQYLC